MISIRAETETLVMLDTGSPNLTSEALYWFREGLSAASEGQFEQAVAAFDRVIQAHPDFYEAWFERGLALESWGYYTQSVASFDHALSQFPPREIAGQIWQERGNALQYGLGAYTEAIICYDQALNLLPDYERAWQNRGNALLYGLSRAEDALACYAQTLQINPGNHLAWRNQGNALVELRRYDEAIASYDKALEINPEDDVSWHARILASERAGLVYQLPTTRRAPCDTEFEKSTFIEVESDTFVSYSLGDTLVEADRGLISKDRSLLIEDDWGRREVLLEKDEYVLGRDPKGDIQLHSQFASRQHATLRRITTPEGEDGYQIRDGDPTGKPSTNGLLINGRKLSKKDLVAGDVVVFGPGVQITYNVTSKLNP